MENPTTFQARKSKISRYCSNSSNKNSNFKPNRSETGSTCSHFDFQPFKSRFCSGGKYSVISRPLWAFSAKLASNYKRPYNFRDDTGLQTRVYLNSRPKHSQTTPTNFLFRNGKDRPRNLRALGKRRAACGQTGFRSVYKQFVLVPKRDGKSRSVINLKDLNTFLQYNHFKMEGIHLLRDLLQPHDWLGKIDLKDAYFLIPIWKNHRKYLQVLWKDTLLEFARLPFGLAVAPRLFTKVMKPVVALLRRAGIRLIIYLDDLLFMNQSQVGLEQDMATARYLLENLGFVVNFDKSCFVPTQQ